MTHRLAIIFLILLSWVPARALDIAPVKADIDSLEAVADSLKTDIVRHTSSRSSTRWIGQLVENNFNINAPGIEYPAFPRFVVKVYNWGNYTFNTYDSLYVIAAPGKWKATINNENHVTSSTLAFPHTDYMIRMNSSPYADLSATLSFMALSVSASVNLNKIFGRPITRHSFNFDFTTSRVSGNITAMTSDGGMHITHIGNQFLGLKKAIPFNDVSIKSLTGELFYIFNHRHYSRAAAYCFSKFQLRSAGSWVAGLSFAKQSINMDFSSLDEKYLVGLPEGRTVYNFRYNDYTLLGGYSYNHVIRPRRWMFNIGARLSLGYKHVNEGGIVNRHDMMATNIAGTSALLYTHRNFFASLSCRYTGYLYYTANFVNFTSYLRLTATAGVRF